MGGSASKQGGGALDPAQAAASEELRDGDSFGGASGGGGAEDGPRGAAAVSGMAGAEDAAAVQTKAGGVSGGASSLARQLGFRRAPPTPPPGTQGGGLPGAGQLPVFAPQFQVPVIPPDWPAKENFPYPWPKHRKIEPFNQQVYVEGMMFRDVMDHPIGRTVMSVVAGGVMGAVFGTVFIGLEPPNMAKQEMGFWPTLKDGFKRAGAAAKSSGKNFAMFGGLYGGSEAVIERFRAKHDIWNAVWAGCFTGAGVSKGAGPKGMAVGCVGCAAFSAVIEKYMGFS
mmetsp:Transcript_31532/g.100550  ORF Transcript_31532/g.100550 Transcript_31532/m.100550 type:complete len:283 (+) Transcript_31532:2849-3697(+)